MMDDQDFMMRMNSMVLGSEYGRSTVFSPEVMADILSEMDTNCKRILSTIINCTNFLSKYDLNSKEIGTPMIYAYTQMPCRFTYLMEAFPTLGIGEVSANKRVDELVFNKTFETIIERYTRVGQKPNQVLSDTRSSEFCYRVAIKIEAVPASHAWKPHRIILLREFLILQHLWESYRCDLVANVCNTDHLIGFPMPLEFQNVVGSEYDFVEDVNYTYYNAHGLQDNLLTVSLPEIYLDSSTTIRSSLSYMTSEKLGPSLSYLADLLRAQNKTFSMSSALKIYDQLICRLMIMHKYSTVHCDPNPSCLFFGHAECCNVLYITDFGSSVVKPDSNRQVPRFHDRFVSFMRFRDRKCHFVNDIESAFYIFLYMLLGRLPWDNRLTCQQKTESATCTISSKPVEVRHTDRALTVDDKEKLWQGQDIFNWVFRQVELEFYEPLYKSFSLDLLESLYTRTKDCILTGRTINPVSYAKECGIVGSAVHSFYYGIRRVIATYFRFEGLNPALKDLQGSIKLEMLNKESAKDSRIAWDLSHWCWNHLDPRNPAERNRKLSYKM